MATAPADDEYEDLLSHWLDLEAALAMLLTHPARVREFPAKVLQCDLWLQDIVGHDIDAALYLMFQLATTSTVGYSASHALVCATLCQILAPRLRLSTAERDSLVRAALTMNIGMTALQDTLALQREPPTPEQKQAIASHPQDGVALLESLGIRDDLWLDVIARHHDNLPGQTPLAILPVELRLTRVLASIDRYAAMISPRKSRPGRSATDSVQAMVARGEQQGDEASLALLHTVGLCPPGTFVRLDNGDTAVVLRRSEQANLPLVASVIDAQGVALRQPRLHHTARGAPLVQSALARPAVTVEVNHRTMVRVGLYAAQGSRNARSKRP